MTCGRYDVKSARAPRSPAPSELEIQGRKVLAAIQRMKARLRITYLSGRKQYILVPRTDAEDPFTGDLTESAQKLQASLREARKEREAIIDDWREAGENAGLEPDGSNRENGGKK